MKVLVFGATGMVGQPKYVTTTEELGRAMIAVARHGAPKRGLENQDIGAIARTSSTK